MFEVRSDRTPDIVGQVGDELADGGYGPERSNGHRGRRPQVFNRPLDPDRDGADHHEGLRGVHAGLREVAARGDAEEG
jgi:hypothetical protein